MTGALSKEMSEVEAASEMAGWAGLDAASLRPAHPNTTATGVPCERARILRAKRGCAPFGATLMAHRPCRMRPGTLRRRIGKREPALVIASDFAVDSAEGPE